MEDVSVSCCDLSKNMEIRLLTRLCVFSVGEFCTLRAQAAIRIPEDMDATKCAPLLCAGATVFDAIKGANLRPGSTVAVQGLGGLGHMAVQFARKMGYRVIAISRGSEKEASVRRLGAREDIDATTVDVGDALAKLGPADLVLTTAMDTAAMTPLIKGIAIYGKLLILSFPQPGTMTVDANVLLMRGISVQGWPAINSHQVQKAVDFAHLHGIECAVEVFPLSKAQEAFGTYISLLTRFSTLRSLFYMILPTLF